MSGGDADFDGNVLGDDLAAWRAGYRSTSRRQRGRSAVAGLGQRFVGGRDRRRLESTRSDSRRELAGRDARAAERVVSQR